MRARDIMSSPVYTVRDDNSVEDAAAMLATRDITAARVLNEANRVVGMVSEADVLRNRCPPTRSCTRGAPAAKASPGIAATRVTQPT